jgi:hypothetical protein
MSRIAQFALVALVISATATVADAAKRRAGSVAASADETGLVGLHDLRREGGKVCMSDHTHSGSSTGQPTKKAAEVVAMQQWASFTSWEYGSAWGNPGLAGSKTMRCGGTPGTFSCDFEARPCRR